MSNAVASRSQRKVVKGMNSLGRELRRGKRAGALHGSLRSQLLFVRLFRFPHCFLRFPADGGLGKCDAGAFGFVPAL